MKRFIDGRVFDTAKADLLLFWDNGLAEDRFEYCEETLYRSSSGRYFLHGKGGPLSPYAVQRDDGSRSSGEQVVRLDEVEALNWLEAKNADPDVIDNYFHIADA